VYLGVVSNQLNVNANPLLTKISQTTSDVWGSQIRKLAPYGLNGGVGAGTEDGDLPKSYQNNYVNFVSDLKNLYGTINITDKAMRASSHSASAFVNLLNSEMEGLIKASAFNFGRMLYGDGSGLLATVSVTGESKSEIAVDSVKNLMEGMVVDIYNGDTLFATGVRIAYVDRVNKKVTFESEVSSAPEMSYKLYVQGSKGNELTGLGAIFGDGNTLYGVDKTKYKWMVPYVKSGVKTIDDATMQEAIDYLDEVSGSNVDFIACSSDIKRAYQKYLGEFRRNIDVMELNGGFKALTFNGVPVVSDRFIEDGSMYLLNTSEFALHQLCDWDWLEGENGKIIKQDAGKPTYTATLVKYADLICNKPNGQALLKFDFTTNV
ncbi:MAG: phage major capsid protein, partial [Christensenellales bacterium]